VFPARKKVVFVHGCFWHGHGCKWGQLPKSRPEYWTSKIETNRERNKRVLTELRHAGWEPLVVWQCELRDIEGAIDQVEAFLRS
jgi:DNA mismatch endonuclease (patch repair protein)